MKDINEDAIIEKYKELGNIWKVGEFFGIKGQKVHSILVKNNIPRNNPRFSEKEKNFLIENYEHYVSQHRLSELATLMGRTEISVEQKASRMGLGKQSRKYDLSEEQHKENSEKAKERIKKYGHPRGMLGKKHSDKFKEGASERSKRNWRERPEIYRIDERREEMSTLMSEMQIKRGFNQRSRCYETDTYIGDKRYLFKSNWELNIAIYLEYLLLMGEIKDWEYEPTRFSFMFNEYGVRTYAPDFLVRQDDGDKLIELKGWVDEKTKSKIKLMKEYYPNINIEIWTEKEYRSIEKEYKAKINTWDWRLQNKEQRVCCKIVAEKFVDKENPRVEFKIVTID